VLDAFPETVCCCGVDVVKTRPSISAGAANFARVIDLGRNLRPISRAYFNEKNGDLGLNLSLLQKTLGVKILSHIQKNGSNYDETSF
jgi:hypothetical protein